MQGKERKGRKKKTRRKKAKGREREREREERKNEEKGTKGQTWPCLVDVHLVAPVSHENGGKGAHEASSHNGHDWLDSCHPGKGPGGKKRKTGGRMTKSRGKRRGEGGFLREKEKKARGGHLKKKEEKNRDEEEMMKRKEEEEEEEMKRRSLMLEPASPQLLRSEIQWKFPRTIERTF